MWKPLKLAPWLLAATAAWSVGFVYNAYVGGELSWLRGMYQQKMAIAAQVDSPQRLLIVGGSGAHYSVDSERLEQELGIPVINLGLDGPVGLNVILASIDEAIRPGDIVLLIPEDLIIIDDDGILERSTAFSVAVGKPAAGNIPPKQFAQDFWMMGIPTLRALTKSAVDLVEKGKLAGYYSDPVSDRGDPTATKSRTGKWWKWKVKQPITQHAIARISQFRDDIEAKGATLILSLPWLYASSDSQTIANVTKTAKAMEKIAPTVYDPQTLNLQTDSRLFADTHYHLKPEARIMRAKALAKQLKPVISQINAQSSH